MEITPEKNITNEWRSHTAKVGNRQNIGITKHFKKKPSPPQQSNTTANTVQRSTEQVVQRKL